MKTFYIDSYADFLRDATHALDKRADELAVRLDELDLDAEMLEARYHKTEAEADWQKLTATLNEYKRIRYARDDVKAAADALYKAAEAFGNLEVDARDVLKDMGLL